MKFFIRSLQEIGVNDNSGDGTNILNYVHTRTIKTNATGLNACHIKTT